jgi:hypothetical protein
MMQVKECSSVAEFWVQFSAPQKKKKRKKTKKAAKINPKKVN